MQLSIDFGGTDIKVGLIDSGHPRAIASHPTSGTAADLAHAEQMAARLLDEEGVAAAAVGVAVPGTVDRGSGRMLHANAKYDFLRDGRIDLVDWARTRFAAPAIVENDSRAALAGELAHGSARGETDAVMLILGTGIGTAAAVDGVLLRGAHEHAGILGGHVTVDITAGRCTCGNIGCAEALASTRALRERRPGIAGVEELLSAAATDEDADRMLEEFLRIWGATVVTLCHMFDPDLVVLSGGVLRAGARIADPVRDYVDRHLWPSSHRPRFTVPAQPELSVLRGLAALADAAAGASIASPSRRS